MKQNILIVAAHPDDEVLGMGGTIAYHVNRGDRVEVLFLGDGVGSRENLDTDEVRSRQEMARCALRLLGANLYGFEAFADNQFDSVPLLKIIKVIEVAKRKVQPDLVYTHHGGDLNIDHRLTCQAVVTAFRPLPGESCREIRSFEVPSSTEWSLRSVTSPFLPDTFIDISAGMEVLEAALDCYAKELRPAPHSRSVEAILLARRRRGIEVGLKAAEAFMTLRRII